MRLSIGSYSFHRMLASGQQDMFGYIADCKRLGATQLDPWNAHLAPLRARDPQVAARADLSAPAAGCAPTWPIWTRFAPRRRQPACRLAAWRSTAPIFTSLAEQARRANRTLAYRWLAVAHRLKAAQVRIDAGGTPELPDEMFAIIVDGYQDLLELAARPGHRAGHREPLGLFARCRKT